jgi:hypothetical protein
MKDWVWKYLESKNRLEKEGKFCGFIWFVIPKIVINIKKRALMEKMVQKKTEKKERKEEDDEIDEEEGKRREDSG